MNDEVFELYRKCLNLLDTKKEKVIFQRGFDLGISEGTARCIEQLKPAVKKINDTLMDVKKK